MAAATEAALALIAPRAHLPVETVAAEYAEQKARLAKRGRLIAEFDLIIGVTGVSYGYTVVTDNVKHFERTEGIAIENWPK